MGASLFPCHCEVHHPPVIASLRRRRGNLVVRSQESCHCEGLFCSPEAISSCGSTFLVCTALMCCHCEPPHPFLVIAMPFPFLSLRASEGGVAISLFRFPHSRMYGFSVPEIAASGQKPSLLAMTLGEDHPLRNCHCEGHGSGPWQSPRANFRVFLSVIVRSRKNYHYLVGCPLLRWCLQIFIFCYNNKKIRGVGWTFLRR